MKKKQVLWCVFSDIDTTGSYQVVDAFYSCAMARKHIKEQLHKCYVVGPFKIVIDISRPFLNGKS